MISTSSEGKEMEKDLVTPPRKKLKQARLSFQKLSPSVDTTSPKNVKKRKISEGSSDEIKVLKVIKPNDEQSVSHDENDMPEVSHNTKIEKCSPSACNNQDTNLKVSENYENGHLEKAKQEKNHASEILEKEAENLSNSIESKTDDTDISRSKNDIHSENSNQELQLTAPENASSLKSDDVPSTTEEQVIENDSVTSETDSDEISDGDNELNETVEDFNSSGSCHDVTKDEADQNSSKSNLNNVSNVSCTPKSKLMNSEETQKKKLTPKQLLQRENAAKRREEKEKQRKEKEEKKAEEKERKLKEKEQRKKEKEEQRRKEKEEKEKKKQAELEQKSEEKRLKEEERRKKEEQRVLEKRKKDERKLAEEEAKKKEEEVKKKEAAAFANFFVASKGASKTTEEVKVKAVEHFMPFQVKVDMRLAPLLRSNFNESRMETFETMFREQSTTDLYLAHLKKRSYVPEKTGKTWPLSDLREVVVIDDDDVIPVSSDNEVVESHPAITHHKAKLLLFCENRRPPYWGTWTKRSKSIKPACPFNKDEGFFDYEVDSDDEWEEEEPGESLHGSDDEKESEDEYEVDNEFFVPHGYLSDEENCEEEETVTPETMKAKLKYMEMEFEEEMKHKTERIKPRLFGCFWTNQNSNEVGARVLALLSSYRAVFRENPIVLSGPSTPEVSSPVHENQGACPSTGSKKKKFPESFVPALIKLVHGNINGRGFLVKEFYSYMRSELDSAREESTKDSESNPTLANAVIVSKIKISEKIKQIASWIACPEEGPFLNRMCWYVSPEIRSAYGLEDLNIPNKVWNYINTPKRELELSNTIPSPVISDMNTKCKSLPLITKFTKKMSQEELQRQLSLAGSCAESDIEMQDDIKILSTSDDNGKMPSGSVESDKTNCSMKASGDKVKSQIASVKTSTESLNNGQKKSENSGTREKLLQFKSKGSIIPHLENRKRVPILKSVPLGQAILPTTEASISNRQENQSNVDKSHDNDVKDPSNVDNCIVID